ncbi:MAG: energy-coupled thiamine transporter ThiT [Candidatus Bathyarchaeota archaeon]|nr:MAG: energy-coupled thiamine transporter ThiT [Candidatus Bathyarchaeota archaeon]
MLAEGNSLNEKRFPTKILTELSVVVALSVILKDILPPIYPLPQGGSITIAGLVPLFWFTLRRGFRIGAFAGFIFGLVHMALGGYVINPIQGLLDYPLAFAALGLAGLFKKYRLVGVGVGIVGRFICSFLSGIFFFASPTVEGAIASAIYNGTYLIGEFIISVAVIYLLIKRGLLEIYL